MLDFMKGLYFYKQQDINGRHATQTNVLLFARDGPEYPPEDKPTRLFQDCFFFYNQCHLKRSKGALKSCRVERRLSSWTIAPPLLRHSAEFWLPLESFYIFCCTYTDAVCTYFCVCVCPPPPLYLLDLLF